MIVVTSIAVLFFIGIWQNDLAAGPDPHSLHVSFAKLGFVVIHMLIVTALVFQTLRFILLGDQAVTLRSFVGRDFWRYAGLVYGLMLAFIVGSVVIVVVLGFATRALGWRGPFFPVVATCLCMLLLTWAWIRLRITLLLTHVALGGAMRWRAAWRDTRGHSGRIALAYLGVTISVTGAAIVIGMLGGLVASILDDGRTGPVMLLTREVILVPATVIAAACSTWIYRRHASELLVEGRDGGNH
ncbi:hypothetical protein [Paraburkholderia sp. ZP32-5]|uniref:hypothetical protein n=1 Tax=Paraburkholderia sp. ZP32-5 TaxID=2883245 RepID=UPI001F18B0A4|nr:hypothetical protein [Paraburkholderia sp. ZP32-5]